MKVNICQFNYNTLAIEKNKDKIKDVLLQNEDDVLTIFTLSVILKRLTACEIFADLSPIFEPSDKNTLAIYIPLFTFNIL